MAAILDSAGSGGPAPRKAAPATNMMRPDGDPNVVATSTLGWSAPTADSAPRSRMGQQMAAGGGQRNSVQEMRQQRASVQKGTAGMTVSTGKVGDSTQSASSSSPTFVQSTGVVPSSPSQNTKAAGAGKGEPSNKRKLNVHLPGADDEIHRMNVDVLSSPNPVADDIPQTHKLSDPIALSSIEDRTLSEFDDLFRQKNYYLGVLVVIALALMLIIFQYPYHPETGVYDSTSDSVWIMQTVISAVTAWHLWKIYDYYQLIIVTDRVKYSLRTRDGILNSFRLKFMLAEMLLVVLHSVPYVMEVKPELFIFLRMYQLFRTLRDHSPVYRWRKKIITHGHLAGLPEFDTSLTIRTYFHLYPWQTIFLFIAWWLLVLSYCIYVFERELQKGLFTFANTIYFTAGTMATLGYGDYVPISNGGRTIAMCAVVVGILCSALLITALLKQIRLTPNQLRIAEFVAEEQLNQTEQTMAAILIQRAWKRYFAAKKDAASQGVEVMLVTPDGVEATRKRQHALGENVIQVGAAVDQAGVAAASAVRRSLHARHTRPVGMCGTSCCGMYDKPPTEKEVRSVAMRNRELRYYRFLTNVANSSNVNPIHNLEQRMDRIEDMALYQLEVLAGIQKSLAMLTGVDDTAGASTTEHSPQNSRPASSVASTAAAPVKRGSLLQQPASK